MISFERTGKTMLEGINWPGEYFTYAYFQMLMKQKREGEKQTKKKESKNVWVM